MIIGLGLGLPSFIASLKGCCFMQRANAGFSSNAVIPKIKSYVVLMSLWVDKTNPLGSFTAPSDPDLNGRPMYPFSPQYTGQSLPSSSFSFTMEEEAWSNLDCLFRSQPAEPRGRLF